jgi:hypothetical protein
VRHLLTPTRERRAGGINISVDELVTSPPSWPPRFSTNTCQSQY